MKSKINQKKLQQINIIIKQMCCCLIGRKNQGVVKFVKQYYPVLLAAVLHEAVTYVHISVDSLSNRIKIVS